MRDHLRAAALLSGPRAFEHWQRWRAQETLEDCSHPSHYWLPALARSLRDQPLDASDLNKLRGLSRFCWTTSQRLSHQAGLVIAALQEAGLGVLLTGGLAVAHGIRGDLGMRSQHGFELLIRPEERAACLKVLQQHGFQLSYGLPKVDFWHSCELSNAQDMRLELRWFAHQEGRWPGADAPLWERAQDLVRPNLPPIRIPCANDLLLAACLHEEPLDISALVRHPNLDWEVFYQELARRRLARKVLPALLRAAPWEELPGDWQSRLKAIPSWRGEWLDLQSADQPWRPLLAAYLDYLRGQQPPDGGTPGAFAEFLRQRWALRHRWQVPIRMLRFGLRMLWKRSLP